MCSLCHADAQILLAYHHRCYVVIDACLCQIRQGLLAWYDEHHRVLPWRRNQFSLRQPKADDKYQGVALETPQQQFAYYVWVCEIMSQQTQVPRVAEYFTRWIHKWPTVQVGVQCGMQKQCSIHYLQRSCL